MEISISSIRIDLVAFTEKSRGLSIHEFRGIWWSGIVRISAGNPSRDSGSLVVQLIDRNS